MSIRVGGVEDGQFFSNGALCHGAYDVWGGSKEVFGCAETYL